MPNPRMRTGFEQLLRGLSKALALIAGISFLFGGGLLHTTINVDRILGEILGIGLAFVCVIGGGIAYYWVEDIEWKEVNEDAAPADRTGKP